MVVEVERVDGDVPVPLRISLVASDVSIYDVTVVEDLGLHVPESASPPMTWPAGGSSSPVRGIPKLYSSSTWQRKLSRDMAARPARAASNECPVNLLMSTPPAYLTLWAPGRSHCAPCTRRTSTKWCPTCRKSRSVTSDEKSWVPSKTATQRSSQSATFACVVAPGHVSTFVIPEKPLYSNDHDGTEPPAQPHPPLLRTGSCCTLMLHTTPGHSPSWDTL